MHKRTFTRKICHFQLVQTKSGCRRSSSIASVRIEKVSPGHWLNIENRRLFFDDVAKQLQLSTQEDWYHVKPKELYQRGGYGLLSNYYGKSIGKALESIYPEHKWALWKFDSVPDGYWDNLENQKFFFDTVAKELNLKNIYDWYSVKVSTIYKRGGYGLLVHHYNGSLARALATIYPQYEWHPWRFERVPVGFWDDNANVIAYIHWLAEQLGVARLEDWLMISIQNIPKATNFIRTRGGLENILCKIYPQFKQILLDFKARKNRSKAQSHLLKIVTQAFPLHEVREDYKHANLHYSDSGKSMELDIYVPQLQLAFEYQGEHHYLFHYLAGSHFPQVQRDKQKKQACIEAGITLIEIPFWWDRQKSSILATILKYRPDLAPFIELPVGSKPISETPPHQVAKRMALPGPNMNNSTASSSVYYRVKLGRPGKHPRCRGCGRTISNKRELRIQVRGTFTPINDELSTPFPTVYSICLKNECLTLALKKYGNIYRNVSGSNSGIYFPRFDNELGVPIELQERFDDWVKGHTEDHSQFSVKWVPLS